LLYRHIIPASFEPRRITTRRRVFAADLLQMQQP
jgi:hypothetical protein